MIGMTAVEGERAAGPRIDDEAPAPPPEQVNPLPPEPATPEPGPIASSAGDEPAQHDAVPSARGTALPEPREPVEVWPPGSDGQSDEVPLPDPPASSETTTSPEPAASPETPASAETSESPETIAEPETSASPEPVASPETATSPGPPASVPAGRPVRRRAWRVAGALLLAVLLTAGGGVVGAWAALTLRPPVPPPPAPTPTGLLDAVSAVAPAVLRIQSGAPDTGTAGTALVVTPTGDIVTNEHLVHGESTATLIAPDGRSSTARVVAANEEADIAWLRIDGAQGLPVVRLAGPAAVRPGDDVVAIGNALNLDGPPSVTRGVVSAIGRSTATLTDVIQTDAAISSGSSGGALVDRSGTVVGITTEALVGDPSVSVEDIAFAIPADRVVTVLRGMGLDLPPAG
jgi:putative serine protease PepD